MNVCDLIDSLLSYMPGTRHLGLRPQTEADWPFLRALFVSRRWAEACAAPGWGDAQRLAFLHSQAELQQRHYAEHFPSAAFLLIEQQQAPIGRLCIQHGAEALHLVDIALLPAWQGQGIGTALIQAMLREAGDLPCTLHVEAFSPAQRLYQRLGFRSTGEQGFYLKMQHPPDPHSASADS
ncbi:GNAT family acetyltransferase [Pseudomonas reidholzensis]|uniref:GNAT family acetyltransferase n=1 Tax=Pseudomonas reidholzensis TaxID=1785162 RepID=A0A383RX87_9PSED|nr:GNAT family N-acetyltransferase [Pseudomonas reidholzensis]SYX91008.1 GNAT family acetyltransferase [Pseudomonas reidholzensis]